jgi:hypothetical protein
LADSIATSAFRQSGEQASTDSDENLRNHVFGVDDAFPFLELGLARQVILDLD